MTALSRRSLSGAGILPRQLADVGDPWAWIASAAAATGVICLAAGGGTVLFRRLGGAFAPPTAAFPWIAVVISIPLIAAVDVARRTGLLGPWASIVGRCGLVLVVLALVPVGPSASEILAAVVPVAIATATALLPSPFARSAQGPDDRQALGRCGHPRQAAIVAPEVPETSWSTEAPLAPGLRQRLERYQSATDGDRIIGRLLVDVPTGSRTGHAHLGFCPPFAAVPTVEVLGLDDGIEAVVSAAEVVPWGVRVECRLSEPAEEPLAIPVDVVARLPT